LWSVLVVDDNPAVRKLICELFAREADFQVCAEADNGRDALSKAQELEPDLVVTDLSMPHMNGLEETRAVRKLMPALPVILYSAHIDSYVAKEALAAGASAVVPKTDVVAMLIATARTLMDGLAAWPHRILVFSVTNHPRLTGIHLGGRAY
jgi:two-component system, NarL family, response regulator NreC